MRQEVRCELMPFLKEADETGLCLRSVNRSIKKFYEEGLITKKGQKILISKEQYSELRKIVEKKIDLS